MSDDDNDQDEDSYNDSYGWRRRVMILKVDVDDTDDRRKDNDDFGVEY